MKSHQIFESGIQHANPIITLPQLLLDAFKNKKPVRLGGAFCRSVVFVYLKFKLYE